MCNLQSFCIEIPGQEKSLSWFLQQIDRVAPAAKGAMPWMQFVNEAVKANPISELVLGPLTATLEIVTDIGDKSDMFADAKQKISQSLRLLALCEHCAIDYGVSLPA